MYIKCYSSAVIGIEAHLITVEVNVAAGCKFFIVGLPDNAVKESEQRIAAAFLNTGFKMPGHKVTVNLAPANIKKEGSFFDLPIAIAILAASEQMNVLNVHKYMIVGEIALDGTLLPVQGTLSMAMEAKKQGFTKMILPSQNAMEAAIVEGLEVYGCFHLSEVVRLLNGDVEMIPTVSERYEEVITRDIELEEDFMDVKGQDGVKRAMEIAAAGGHNMLMIGSPGSGKTMLAKRLCSILPKMSLEESLETTRIHSVAGKIGAQKGVITTRPFRSPHHTVSSVAIVGGGSNPQPGEISLANNGVLFLDELPEFGRNVLEVMRQPLEDRTITIARSKYSVIYPCNFMLVAAMNPCPCGYLSHPDKQCECSIGDRRRYMNRISGPLLDRIDIHIEVLPVTYNDLTKKREGETSHAIRERVSIARNIQQRRFAAEKIFCNAMMSSKQVEKYCVLDDESKMILERAMSKMGFSARAYGKILKLSRTIADLAQCEDIKVGHILQALQYRALDKEKWTI